MSKKTVNTRKKNQPAQVKGGIHKVLSLQVEFADKFMFVSKRHRMSGYATDCFCRKGGLVYDVIRDGISELMKLCSLLPMSYSFNTSHNPEL